MFGGHSRKNIIEKQECWDDDFDFQGEDSSFNSITQTTKQESFKQQTSSNIKPLQFWSEEGDDWSNSFEPNSHALSLKQSEEDLYLETDPFAHLDSGKKIIYILIPILTHIISM